MSQEQQPQKPDPVKYGDVFNVTGQLASQPIAPQDAAILHSAETTALGHAPNDAPAAVLQSAADFNKRIGAVAVEDLTEIVGDQGVTVALADVAGHQVVTEAIAGQVVGQYGRPSEAGAVAPGSPSEADSVTMGEALEATALSASEKAVDASDAAAIQAAEQRATGCIGRVVSGGVAADALCAAAYNAGVPRYEDKAKLGDILTDATLKLSGDKVVTREDAEEVIFAELRNKADLATHPDGVAAAVAAAARFNQRK